MGWYRRNCHRLIHFNSVQAHWPSSKNCHIAVAVPVLLYPVHSRSQHHFVERQGLYKSSGLCYMRLSWRRLVHRPRIPCRLPASHNSAVASVRYLFTAQSEQTRALVRRRQWAPCPGSTYTTYSLRRGYSNDVLQNESTNSHIPADTDTEWEQILEDASIHGIRSKGQLLFEADVGHASGIGSRLVDTSPARQNLDLWRTLLRAQALQNGHDGIKAIWRGLQYRGKAIRFDDTNPQVNPLWQIFLSAGAADHHFLWSLCKVAKRAKFKRPALFAEIVGAALEGDAPQRAVDFAAFLLPSHYRGRDDLVAIFESACHSESADALKDFCRVYEMVPKTQIYSDVATSLWEQDRSADAFMMHSFLASKGDLPPRFEVLEPFLTHLVMHHGKLSSFLLPLNSAGASFEAQARRFWARERSRITGLSPESLNIVASKTLGVNPKKFSDQFVARAFATRAFSFEFTVNSLRMIGLIEVGPQAVRQAALTAPDLATLQARFTKFDDLGVDTGASAFVRIMRKVCNAGRWEMVQALINNDLHHEVFENLDLQERLLAEYYRRKDWLQLNRTLVILNDGEFDAKAQAHAGNLLLRIMLEAGDWAEALNLAKSLQQQGLHLSTNLARTVAHIFRDTKGSELAQADCVDRVAYLIGFLQDILGSGTYFDIKLWRRPLRALGRLGRMKELECLIYWIAEQYMPKRLPQPVRLKRMMSVPSPLEVLFDEKFQRSLVSWCFGPRRGMTAVSPERCLRWTRILKRLRDVYGVQVKEYNLRWTFIRRLRWLFAPGIRLKPHNMWTRVRNTTPVSRYWELYDMMWDMRPAGHLRYDRHTVLLQMRRRKIPPAGGRQPVGAFQPSSGAAIEGSQTKRADKDVDIVVYRDLFHASWEDYSK
ncbi:hypothetical protein A1O3_02210 [Capronia epimyces CBS 606.96]|uniref:Pentatricopeptide repeat domain-containing protein n=1 Tax=Capronia epimyces CBS 606.96 TaxID=1182542 RepID=W9YIR2_9EURO|nr:uncharacterized protein A1O3_02210 [Capronia epimyces CBS 606.96]EXJ89146.1 hypothetical protein A1O3_02210 [Capronia epimyces CBS 606.96]